LRLRPIVLIKNNLLSQHRSEGEVESSNRMDRGARTKKIKKN